MTRDELVASLDTMGADAARYRWLRANWARFTGFILADDRPVALDAAIDKRRHAAMLSAPCQFCGGVGCVRCAK